jgi:adenylate kinase
VLIGFPRTRKQSLALQTAGILATHFALLTLPDSVIMDRSSGRRVNPDTGGSYVCVCVCVCVGVCVCA